MELGRFKDGASGALTVLVGGLFREAEKRLRRCVAEVSSSFDHSTLRETSGVGALKHLETRAWNIMY